MKKLNNPFILLLVALLMLSSGPVASAATQFNDVNNSFWAKDEITYLANQSIIRGYDDGSFKPNNTVTRTQAAIMIVHSLGISTENRPAVQFNDIKDDFHAYEYVAAISDEGIMNGSNGNFRPNEALTRGQMAAIIDRAFKLPRYQEEKQFTDIGSGFTFYTSIQNLAYNRITTGYGEDQTFRPNASSTRAQFSVFLARVLDDTFKPESKEDTVDQIIVVSTTNLSAQRGTLRTYERVNGKLERKFAPMGAVFGYNGIGQNKREGDGQTPMGTYDMGMAFGTAAPPRGTRSTYQRMTSDDYWIDDVNSPDYNQWKRYTGNPSSKWNSFERMNIDLYKYGVVIEYNTNPIVPGNGSAIFLHKWRDSISPTAGCVAVSESNLVELLKWIDPKKSPTIIITLEDRFMSELDRYR
jgi:L,D-peptidoglycan transpeptidase YkuD (ErfK/YbiS/YcfS/YnhG family)